MGGVCCIPRRRSWGTIWAGGRLTVSRGTFGSWDGLFLTRRNRSCQQPIQYDVLEYGQGQSDYKYTSYDSYRSWAGAEGKPSSHCDCRCLLTRMKQGTFSKDKHEILFQRFKINYDKEDEIWKKGSVVYRKVPSLSSVYWLVLIMINSSRTSKQSRSRHRRNNLFHQQMTKQRRNPCQKHKWKKKERGNKRPGLWLSTSISSRINSGTRIPGFWSNHMRQSL
jgi:hypothetical protein